MTKKDYELIAQAIKDERTHCSDEHKKAIDGVSDLLCSRLAVENPRFNKERFLKACGVVENSGVGDYKPFIG